MKIYLSQWLNEDQAKSLTRQNHEYRLLSFYHLDQQGITPEQIQEYIEQGTFKPIARKPLPKKLNLLQLLEPPKNVNQ